MHPHLTNFNLNLYDLVVSFIVHSFFPSFSLKTDNDDNGHKENKKASSTCIHVGMGKRIFYVPRFALYSLWFFLYYFTSALSSCPDMIIVNNFMRFFFSLILCVLQ
jgi:hypothetical protein